MDEGQQWAITIAAEALADYGWPQKPLDTERTGVVLGTPSFMSPEQLQGRPVTGRSDLFSLAVSLYQLLTGQLPFRGDTMPGLMMKIAQEPHPRICAMTRRHVTTAARVSRRRCVT